MSGKSSTIKDFFLGGRSLPWPAVCGSIIATEISGVTFIGVAGSLFALHGNFTYLLWGIGSVIGRVIVAKFFVPRFYEEEIYSPYDYMGRKLGKRVKQLATIVFTVGSILGQSVRVFVAAIPLTVVTGLPIEICIVVIGLFAIAWTLMGGMQTVIWTDVMQFVLFTVGGLVALFWVVSSINGGWPEFWKTAETFGRTKVWDGRIGLEAHLQFTFWVAVLAVPFQNLTAFGVDQLNAQRMFCCKNANAASKALIWSSVGQLLTLLMLLVGSALFVHYNEKPFTPEEGRVVMGIKSTDEEGKKLSIEAQRGLAAIALKNAKRIEHPDARNAAKEIVRPELVSNVAVPSKPDNVFPMWIVKVLPVGLSGLILAGVFAAAISSLDSILAALSQTTLSLFYNPEKKSDEELSKLNLLKKSRQLVVVWGIILTLFTIVLVKASEGIPLLSLAFGMTAYTMGPLLGIFLCCMIGRGSFRGLLIGAIISFILVMLLRTDIWVLVAKVWEGVNPLLANLPTYSLEKSTDVSGAVRTSLKPIYNFAWAWPVTTFLTLACGMLIPSGKKD